jgi:hypothetical protein
MHCIRRSVLQDVQYLAKPNTTNVKFRIGRALHILRDQHVLATDGDTMTCVVKEPNRARTGLAQSFRELIDAKQHVVARSILERVEDREPNLTQGSSYACDVVVWVLQWPDASK